jgi:hypothetical protein
VTAVCRGLFALAWLSMPLLWMLPWLGDVRRGSTARDAVAAVLWLAATAANAALYVRSRTWTRPPLVILWFLGATSVCALCLAAALAAPGSHLLGAASLVSAVALVSPVVAGRDDASPLVALMPRPSEGTAAWLGAHLLAAVAADVGVFEVGALGECAAAQGFVLIALEQLSASSADAGLVSRGPNPHGFAA